MKPTIGGKSPKDNSRRRYPGTGGRRHNPVNIEVRREEAVERQAAWSALSPREKLAALDRRLGEGVGARKQRALLTTSLRIQTGRPDGRDSQLLKNEVIEEGPRPLKAKERRELERNTSKQNR